MAARKPLSDGFHTWQVARNMLMLFKDQLVAFSSRVLPWCRVLKDYITPTAAAERRCWTLDPATYNINSNQITKANKVGTDWFHEVFKSAPQNFP
jgi:hypothetical protein